MNNVVAGDRADTHADSDGDAAAGRVVRIDGGGCGGVERGHGEAGQPSRVAVRLCFCFRAGRLVGMGVCLGEFERSAENSTISI